MDDLDYEHAVSSFYEGLYRFAFSLAGNESDACELTQETYARLLTKGGQVREPPHYRDADISGSRRARREIFPAQVRAAMTPA